jgi:hypothetical protein
MPEHRAVSGFVAALASAVAALPAAAPAAAGRLSESPTAPSRFRPRAGDPDGTR